MRWVFAMRRPLSSSGSRSGSAGDALACRPEIEGFIDCIRRRLFSDKTRGAEESINRIYTDGRRSYAEFHGRRWFVPCAAKVGRGALYAVPRWEELAADSSKAWVLDPRTIRAHTDSALAALKTATAVLDTIRNVQADRRTVRTAPRRRGRKGERSATASPTRPWPRTAARGARTGGRFHRMGRSRPWWCARQRK